MLGHVVEGFGEVGEVLRRETVVPELRKCEWQVSFDYLWGSFSGGVGLFSRQVGEVLRREAVMPAPREWYVSVRGRQFRV